MVSPAMEWLEAQKKVRRVVEGYHESTGCGGKVRGLFCNCEREVMKMMIFREQVSRWLS